MAPDHHYTLRSIPSQLTVTNRNLSVPNRFNTGIIERPISNDLVPSNSRQNLSPESPVNTTENQNANTNNREDIVWVPIGVPVTLRRDEWNKGQEDVGKEVDNRDGEVCVPWRCPVLGFVPLKVDQSDCDKAVYPSAGICVPESC